MNSHRSTVFRLGASLIVALFSILQAKGQDKLLRLTLRSRVGSPSPGRDSVIVEKKAAWDPKRTAIIICDMWDNHWCQSAARRVAELAGPMNEVVKTARAKKVFIIHAPSSVMNFYRDT